MPEFKVILHGDLRNITVPVLVTAKDVEEASELAWDSTLMLEDEIGFMIEDFEPDDVVSVEEEEDA